MMAMTRMNSAIPPPDIIVSVWTMTMRTIRQGISYHPEVSFVNGNYQYFIHQPTLVGLDSIEKWMKDWPTRR